MHRFPSIAVLVLLFSGAPGLISAQPFLKTEALVGFPILSGLFTGFYPGARVEWSPDEAPWALELTYAFHSLADYQYDHEANRWSGLWAPGGFPGDWPFYQTTHVVTPGVLALWRRGPVTIHTGLGVLVQITLGTEALDYYPDFRDEFNRIQSQEKVVLGNSWKLGGDWEPIPGFTMGTDLIYEVADWRNFLRDMPENLWAYSRMHAHTEFRLGIHL